MEGEIRERTVIGLLARIMRGRNVSMKAKRRSKNSIFLPTLTYGLQTWTWNTSQDTSVKSAYYGNQLSERSMEHDKMAG